MLRKEDRMLSPKWESSLNSFTWGHHYNQGSGNIKKDKVDRMSPSIDREQCYGILGSGH